MPKFIRLRGFTLIELLVSLAIMGILASITIPIAEITHQRNKERDLRLALREIRHAVDAYKRAYDDGKILNLTTLSGYPPSLEVLVDGVVNQRDPLHHKLYFLRRIPRNPLNDNSGINDDATWAKRSYASEANDPREGEDVFDIYANTDKLGLNDVPYKKW